MIGNKDLISIQALQFLFYTIKHKIQKSKHIYVLFISFIKTDRYQMAVCSTLGKKAMAAYYTCGKMSLKVKCFM